MRFFFSLISGPGLVFVVYPEGIAQMPISPLWSFLFFFMILTIGLDTQFAMFEAVITGLTDEYPKLLRRYKPHFTGVVCFVCFLLGLPMVTQVEFSLSRFESLLNADSCCEIRE